MSLTDFPNGITSFGVPVLGGGGIPATTGKIFWVDSGTGSDDDDGKKETPFAKIDYAIGKCTANNGDIILVYPGHVETVIKAAGLVFDIAGVTVIFLGPETNRGYITFTTVVGADMDIDAANVTLINPKFVAGIDALTGPIDVNAADFTMINGEYHDFTDMNTTDCIVGVAGATRLKIDGWKYFKSNEGGTAKESHIQMTGVDDCILKNLYVDGDFDTAIIENGADELLRITMEDHYLNNTAPSAGPCAKLDAACSGIARRLDWRSANGAVVDHVADINWSASALEYSTDGHGGSPIGAGATIMGRQVSRPTAVIADADTSLFTIAGGRVVVHAIVGQVTTVVQTQATGLVLLSNPTTGTSFDLCAVLDATADEVGCLYGITGLFSDALIGSNAGATVCPRNGIVLPVGTIDLENAGAANTGSVKWDLWYTPLDADATVVAA